MMSSSEAAPRYGPSRIRRSGLAEVPAPLRLVGPDRKCVVRCYPLDDAQFEADAQTAVADLQRTSQGRDRLLEEVRSRMKLAYPAVTIRPRHELAAGDDPDDLWYFFRDGGVFRP
jgi:hypothetical protein